jgi:hypothetical protein
MSGEEFGWAEDIARRLWPDATIGIEIDGRVDHMLNTVMHIRTTVEGEPAHFAVWLRWSMMPDRCNFIVPAGGLQDTDSDRGRLESALRRLREMADG